MPTFKLSRFEPAAAALLDVVQRRQTQAEEDTKARREFKATLVKALAEKGLLDPQSAMRFDPVTGDTSMLSLRTPTIPRPSDLQPGDVFSMNLPGGGRLTRRGLVPRVTPQKFLSEPQAAKTFEGIQPGQPFQGSIPLTPAGSNTFQSLINQGRTEAPPPPQPGGFGVSRIPQPNRLSLASIMPFLQQFSQFTNPLLGRLASSTSPVPTATTSLLSRPTRASFTPQPTPDLQTEANELQDLIQQGAIRTRDAAEQIIQEAGYDPSDPAFSAILDQLP